MDTTNVYVTCCSRCTRPIRYLPAQTEDKVQCSSCNETQELRARAAAVDTAFDGMVDAQTKIAEAVSSFHGNQLKLADNKRRRLIFALSLCLPLWIAVFWLIDRVSPADITFFMFVIVFLPSLLAVLFLFFGTIVVVLFATTGLDKQANDLRKLTNARIKDVLRHHSLDATLDRCMVLRQAQALEGSGDRRRPLHIKELVNSLFGYHQFGCNDVFHDEVCRIAEQVYWSFAGYDKYVNDSPHSISDATFRDEVIAPLLFLLPLCTESRSTCLVADVLGASGSHLAGPVLKQCLMRLKLTTRMKLTTRIAPGNYDKVMEWGTLAFALARIGDTSSADLIFEGLDRHWDSSYLRFAAIMSLAKLKDSRAVPLLEELPGKYEYYGVWSLAHHKRLGENNSLSGATAALGAIGLSLLIKRAQGKGSEAVPGIITVLNQDIAAVETSQLIALQGFEAYDHHAGYIDCEKYGHDAVSIPASNDPVDTSTIRRLVKSEIENRKRRGNQSRRLS